MPQTQDTDGTAEPVSDFAPVGADMHISVADRTVPAIVGPIVTRRGVWPLTPWRWALLAIALLIAITCGPAAADPAVNMADLLVFISLGVFVAAFTPGRD